MSFATSGSFPASIVPMPNQVTVQDNYLDFNTVAGGQWAQQYLPELYEQEVERYGNRTLSGFLRMVGAEMPMTSDQVIWSEQNRLHIGYDNVAISGANGTAAQTFTVTLAPGNQVVVRKNQTFVVQNPNAPSETLKGLITSAPNPGNPGVLTFDAVCYTEPNFASIQANPPAALSLIHI